MYKKPSHENTGTTLQQDVARIAERVEAAVHTSQIGLIIGGSVVAPALFVTGLVATNPSADKYPGALSAVTNMFLGNSAFQGALLVAAGVLATAGYQLYQAHIDKKKLEEKMNGAPLGDTNETERAKSLLETASKQVATRITSLLGLRSSSQDARKFSPGSP